jgi:hypothetical protein
LRIVVASAKSPIVWSSAGGAATTGTLDKLTSREDRRNRFGEALIWLLIAVYAVASLLPSFFPTALRMSTQLGLVVFLPLAFARRRRSSAYSPWCSSPSPVC